eukprot:2710042-Rhodomonas_salina.1
MWAVLCVQALRPDPRAEPETDPGARLLWPALIAKPETDSEPEVHTRSLSSQGLQCCCRRCASSSNLDAFCATHGRLE